MWRIQSQYTGPDSQIRSKNAHPCQRKEIVFKSWTVVIKAGASVRQAIYSEICKHRMVPHLSTGTVNALDARELGWLLWSAVYDTLIGLQVLLYFVIYDSRRLLNFLLVFFFYAFDVICFTNFELVIEFSSGN